MEIAEAREKRHKSDACLSSETPAARTCRDSRLPARGETPLLMLDRWRKLHDELYDSTTGFDITKVDVFCCKGGLGHSPRPLSMGLVLELG